MSVSCGSLGVHEMLIRRSVGGLLRGQQPPTNADVRRRSVQDQFERLISISNDTEHRVSAKSMIPQSFHQDTSPNRQFAQLGACFSVY